MAKNITPQVEIISMRDKIVRSVDIFGRPFGEVFNGLRGSTTAFQRGSGDARVKSIGFGGQFISVSPGDDIQEAIDFVDANGGGVVFLLTGTHKLITDINLADNIQLIGEGAGQTTMNFGSNSKSLNIVGTSITTAGTISVNNNSQTVTGSSTSFTSATANRDYILISGIWYLIVAIATDTSLTIQLPFATPDVSGDATLIATTIRDVQIHNLKISASAVDGMVVQYANELSFINVGLTSNSTGIDLDDSSNITIRKLDFAANVVDGLNMTNCHYVNTNATIIIDTLVNDSFKLNGCTNLVFSEGGSLNAADDGFNITDCTDISIKDMALTENGESGIELVSGNTNISMKRVGIKKNGSDGIKFTGTTDGCTVSESPIKNNGGYGINVAASDCDDNQLLDNDYNSNSSGAIQDLGTGTIIR